MLFPTNPFRKPVTTVIQEHIKDAEYETLSEPPQDLVLGTKSGVIIVQNIDLATMSVFGEHYNVDPVFFAHHALRMRRNSQLAAVDKSDFRLFESLYVSKAPFEHDHQST